QRELKDNDAIAQNYVVTTAQNSSVILVFSNGATINLAPDSTLAIEQFLQDPFSTSYSMATATDEPSTSVTQLALVRGELVGNVKHLRKDGPNGSSFTVNTPVGAAGIRGTTFRIVFRPDSSGKAFFSLSTAEGEVILTGTTAVTTPVPTGQEVVVTVEVTVDAKTGVVTVTAAPTVVTQDIPPVTQAAIAVAAQEIVTSNAAVIFTSVSTSTNTPAPPPAPEPPPAPPAPPDNTTPGDGK
ncbi:MAG: FecR domain-containing protein, partial [Opitutales bacterium]|nr:FecR domain-containing protein [Opitutales bacterium]